MASDLQLLSFSIEARDSPPGGTTSATVGGDPSFMDAVRKRLRGESTPGEGRAVEGGDGEAVRGMDGEAGRVVGVLNRLAPEMTAEIERGLARLMPLSAGVTVQAEVRFKTGSLVMEGTVVLLSWAGGIAFNTVRDQLADVIKVTVQRTLSSVLAQAKQHLPPLDAAAVPVSMDVKVEPTLPGATASGPSPAPDPVPTAGRTPAAGVPPSPPASRSPVPGWLMLVLGVMGTLVFVLSADLLASRLTSGAAQHDVAPLKPRNDQGKAPTEPTGPATR